MPEDALQSSNDIPETDDDSLHTCACGEQHQHRAGTTSHREECTSPKKFGETCCCASVEAAKEARHRCGHGPRCQ